MPCRGPVTGNETAMLMRKRKVGKGEELGGVGSHESRVKSQGVPRSYDWRLPTRD